MFRHLVGLTEHGVYVTKLVKLVQAKTVEPFSVALLSGIGCNWLVRLAVLCYNLRQRRLIICFDRSSYFLDRSEKNIIDDRPFQPSP
ncbi:formate/nitrite transporter family protein [Paenibacillus sp. N3.4]|uniref:formate/nitrite transporter family protein n=1 Tax=Paenibacillus sp. N3.4 TaxID=2603222 RepID=UPI0021C488FD|nr:formate/nitrite transporter family protein [Paenibacillus sp. N3.4]